jgi:hypothetical protein
LLTILIMLRNLNKQLGYYTVDQHECATKFSIE